MNRFARRKKKDDRTAVSKAKNRNMLLVVRIQSELIEINQRTKKKKRVGVKKEVKERADSVEANAIKKKAVEWTQPRATDVKTEVRLIRRKLYSSLQ